MPKLPTFATRYRELPWKPLIALLVFATATVGFLVVSRLQHGDRAPNPQVDVAQFVDPFIGTAGLGNTFPGATVPWGMVAISPDTGQDPAGYKSGNPFIEGFSQTHLSGVGCPDFGAVLLQPTTGDIATTAEGYRSEYEGESAKPGYYRVDLTRYGVSAQMSATTRASISQYTFPARDNDANIIIDVGHALTSSEASEVNVVSNSEIEGWNRAGGFCGAGNRYTVHFVARVDRPAASTGVWNTGTSKGGYWRFSTDDEDTITVRLGISYVSIANARANLDAEIPQSRSFEEVKDKAYAEWNRMLGRIQVTGGEPEQQTVFYTALYHNLLHPSIYSDVNGDYPATNGRDVRNANGYSQYHVFSLWDTYRTTNSLLTLVYPEKQQDMIKSMLAYYDESGWLPQWQLAGGETGLMVGDPAVVVLAEAYIKGIRNFDVAKAYAAIRKHITQETKNLARPGNAQYLRYGYIPMDDTGDDTVWGVAATSLEYYYADWAAGQLASATGNRGDAATFNAQANNWLRIYDPSTGFIRPKLSNGSWYVPFDPGVTCCDKPWGDGNGGPGYVEGNAWHYTWMIPHDLAGLKQAMGGDAKYTDKLQQAFDSGQYRLWNEPDMHIPYAFSVVNGEAWRIQRQVRRDMRTFTTQRDGIPGNDDRGALSGAFVFDALGFYPVNPASGEYVLGSPVFDSVRILLHRDYFPGKEFRIATTNNAPNHEYIQSAQLNGAPYDRVTLKHDDIIRGGKMQFDMSVLPSEWASSSN